MIKNNAELSMVEALEYLKNSKDEGKEISAFIKKFTKMSSLKAKELREKLNELGIIKMDSKYISKIIDILPETSEDLNKIFSGVGLTEEETKQILDAVRGIK
jgi:DNA-directed RNA polymerase subunit F